MKQNINQNTFSTASSGLFHVKQDAFFTPETKEKLKIYEEILKKWQKSINLVSKKTINEIWTRHFLDSAQVYPLIPATAQTIVDMGSGAGFPGLVLAIMDNDPQNRSLRQPTGTHTLSGEQDNPTPSFSDTVSAGQGMPFTDATTEKQNAPSHGMPFTVHLIESDTRKGLFMKEVIRQLGLTNAVVHTCRIEKMPPLSADVITARALADTSQLLAWADPFMTPDTHCLFLKGAGAADEIKGLEDAYAITCFPSLTAPDSSILHLQNKGVSNGITSTPS